MTTETKPGIRATIDADASTLAFTFPGTALDAITVRVYDLSAEIQNMATLHGLKQKIGDAAAISRNPDTGRSASLADKRAAMAEVLDRLLAGEWNKRREGEPTGGYLLRALMALKPDQDRDALIERLSKLSEKEKAALRANPKVKAIIDEMKAEEGRDSGIDSDALLDSI